MFLLLQFSSHVVQDGPPLVPAAGTSFALVLAFAVCTLFQIDELYTAVEDTLSLEYQKLFEPTTLALTVAMFAMLLAGLAVLAFLMIAEAREQRKQRMVLSDADMQLLLNTVQETVAENEKSQQRASRSKISPISKTLMHRKARSFRKSVHTKASSFRKSGGGRSGSKFGASTQLLVGNPDEAVVGLFHFMGVADPLSGVGIEHVENEWRDLIRRFEESDEAVRSLQKFIRPWDRLARFSYPCH